jgi:hypothetical protein
LNFLSNFLISKVNMFNHKFPLPEPNISCIFKYEFQTLSASDLRDPDMSALIAAKMKEFHGLEMPGPKNISLWDRLRCAFFSLLIPFSL